MTKYKNQNGFTLVELILVIGLFGVLAAIATINLIKPQSSAIVTGTTETITADIRKQQLEAMMDTAQAKGIYFESNQYTLFDGTTYNASDPDNFVLPLSGATTSSNFVNNQLVFQTISGEVLNYSGSQNSFVISHTDGTQKTVSFNEYGILSIN